jgi:hypothetical protein
MTLERGDDVAADLAARQFGNLPLGERAGVRWREEYILISVF